MTYTIMGATGNVGGKIADALLKKGEGVRVLSRSMAKLRSLEERGAKAYAGDAADPFFLTRAFTGADAIFVLTPPDLQSADYRSHSKTVSATV